MGHIAANLLVGVGKRRLNHGFKVVFIKVPSVHQWSVSVPKDLFNSKNCEIRSKILVNETFLVFLN